MLSKPSMMIMRKKMIAKKVAAGIFAMASAYMMNRRLGPANIIGFLQEQVST